MKTVFLDPPKDLSRAMTRVGDALELHAPKHIEIVEKEEDADVVVLHAIGFTETASKAAQIIDSGREYAVIQYCVRTTQEPKTDKWLPIWENAEVVWSYYDLIKLTAEDGVIGMFNFYDAPLGADPDVFRYSSRERRIYTMFTSGYVAESECVDECVQATKNVGGEHFHLGPPDVAVGNHVTSALGMPDSVLARMYQKSQFVAGLRRIEGFELPALEGLFCGARPIMFDAPHYRRWFDEFALLIPEGSPEEVTAEITRLLEKGHFEVSVEVRNHAAAMYNWELIATNFWGTAGL